MFEVDHRLWCGVGPRSRLATLLPKGLGQAIALDRLDVADLPWWEDDAGALGFLRQLQEQAVCPGVVAPVSPDSGGFNEVDDSCGSQLVMVHGGLRLLE